MVGRSQRADRPDFGGLPKLTSLDQPLIHRVGSCRLQQQTPNLGFAVIPTAIAHPRGGKVRLLHKPLEGSLLGTGKLGLIHQHEFQPSRWSRRDRPRESPTQADRPRHPTAHQRSPPPQPTTGPTHCPSPYNATTPSHCRRS